MGKLDDLSIYNKSLHLVVDVYSIIQSNPDLQRDYSLCDQLKRASISVPANIAEGYYRSKKQSQNYLEIASGSTNELMTLLKIVQLIYKINTQTLIEEYLYLAKQIVSFSKSF